jgi:hypothetical protein
MSRRPLYRQEALTNLLQISGQSGAVLGASTSTGLVRVQVQTPEQVMGLPQIQALAKQALQQILEQGRWKHHNIRRKPERLRQQKLLQIMLQQHHSLLNK